jgi:glycosyltransferase involved in cell wall biosynthesis
MSDIAPLAGDEPRPFWSVMIPTYRPDRDFLRQALAGVLAQDPGSAEMEIVIVDDGSPDFDPGELLDATTRRRVALLRRHHAGIGQNWNACIRRARGRWVHILHQDDLVLPGFYERLRAGFETVPGAGAAFCRDVVIDERGARKWAQIRIRDTPGIVADWVEHLFVGLHLRAPALVVRREVYEALGGFRLDLDYVLDWDMWKRIAASYALWYEPEVLACYRRHRGSASFRHMRSGENIAQIGRSIELSSTGLPAAIAADVTRRTRRNYTRYAVESAWRTLMDGDVASCWAQVRAARHINSAAAVALAIGRFLPQARRVPR